MAGPFFEDFIMQVKNTSARLVTVGDVIIVPGQTADIPDSMAASVAGSRSLEIVTAAVKRTRKAATETAATDPEAETAADTATGDK